MESGFVLLVEGRSPFMRWERPHLDFLVGSLEGAMFAGGASEAPGAGG